MRPGNQQSIEKKLKQPCAVSKWQSVGLDELDIATATVVKKVEIVETVNEFFRSRCQVLINNKNVNN